MPNYNIRNNNFRDEVLKVPYPFDSFFTGEINNIVIDTDVFIDAHLYFKTPTVLPVSVTEIDGTFGGEDEVRLVLSDDDNNTVGICSFVSGDTRANIYNPEGINVGIFVLDAIGSERFVAESQGRFFSVVPGDMTLHIDTCKVSTQPSIRYLKAGDSAVFGQEVEIIARRGVQWSRNGDVLSLDVLGEDPSLNETSTPVLSVNGVKSKYIGLNSTPENNLRINTTSEQIVFGQAKELTQ